MMLNLWSPSLIEGVDYDWVYVSDLEGGEMILWFKTPVKLEQVRQEIGGMSLKIGKKWYSYDSTTEVRKVK